MIVKLLTEHHLEFLSLKGGCRGCPCLHLSKCQIVGNLIHWLINLIYYFYMQCLINFAGCIPWYPELHHGGQLYVYGRTDTGLPR